MSIFKHSKFKNTGIIFELLTRQMVSDVLSASKSNASTIIKRHFKQGSELGKELALYRILLEFNKKERTTASKLLDIVLEQRAKIDIQKLKKERYKLLGEIKTSFNEETFFTSRIPNYKLLASIYKLFENTAANSPIEYVNTYDSIIENIVLNNSEKQQLTESINEWETQSSEVKQLALRLIIEKFNNKYKNLKPKQRTLISKFINENIDSTSFKDYILTECSYIKRNLKSIETKITEPALQIKLREVTTLLNEIQTSKFIKEEYLNALLSYYELVELLK